MSKTANSIGPLMGKPSKKNGNRLVFFLAIAVCLMGCDREEAIPITADFSIQVVDNDLSVPVEIRISDKTVGAETYNWIFEGGSPPGSTDRNPGSVIYTEAGNYDVTLEASNQDGVFETKTLTLVLFSELSVGFTTEVIDNNFPPMEVALTNTSIGAETYSWIFQEGEPFTTTEKDPANVVFYVPGEHTISLEVNNGFETQQTSQTLTVAPNLVAAFEYVPDFTDDDLQAPVTLNMANTSVSATAYSWSFQGGNPSESTNSDPTVRFDLPGTYELRLEATNGKETQTTTQTVTVAPNTNLSILENIQLGINTAHNDNVVGAFFSTTTREVYAKEVVTEAVGPYIDIAFFGLNADFGFNKFVSPDQVQTYTFNAIPNATQTTFINTVESCKLFRFPERGRV